MKVRYAALPPLILVFLLLGVLATQAEDNTPLLVEEGTVPVNNPTAETTPQETAALGYKISTSNDDPLCDTGFDGYVNLEEHGIGVTGRVPTGDNYAVGPFFTSGAPIDFFGKAYDGLWLTDDGFVLFDPANYNKPWEPQIIPQNDMPNGLVALLWQNMEIVYKRDKNHGVTLAASPDGEIVIVEFDDIRLVDAPDHRFDVEMVMRRAVSHTPGDYEIIFAYDNLQGTLAGPLTVGVENVSGDKGTALVNKDSAKQVISNGLMVCFDAISGTPPTSTPSSIQASDGAFEDRVRVTWTGVDKATRYDVYRADENGNYEMKLDAVEGTLFRDYSAAAGTLYTYRVKACNEHGCSQPSEQDVGWRAGEDDPAPPPPPPAPRLLENILYLPFFKTK
jgi:hypothetical protein